LFNQLGLSQKDGYTTLRTQPEIHQAMQKWLDENNGKYRIQRYVVDPNAKAQAVNPGLEQNGGRVLIRPLPIQVQPLPIKRD
jgi:hypothetical protein